MSATRSPSCYVCRATFATQQEAVEHVRQCARRHGGPEFTSTGQRRLSASGITSPIGNVETARPHRFDASDTDSLSASSIHSVDLEGLKATLAASCASPTATQTAPEITVTSSSPAAAAGSAARRSLSEPRPARSRTHELASKDDDADEAPGLQRSSSGMLNRTWSAGPTQTNVNWRARQLEALSELQLLNQSVRRGGSFSDYSQSVVGSTTGSPFGSPSRRGEAAAAAAAARNARGDGHVRRNSRLKASVRFALTPRHSNHAVPQPSAASAPGPTGTSRIAAEAMSTEEPPEVQLPPRALMPSGSHIDPNATVSSAASSATESRSSEVQPPPVAVGWRRETPPSAPPVAVDSKPPTAAPNRPDKRSLRTLVASSTAAGRDLRVASKSAPRMGTASSSGGGVNGGPNKTGRLSTATATKAKLAATAAAAAASTRALTRSTKPRSSVDAFQRSASAKPDQPRPTTGATVPTRACTTVRSRSPSFETTSGQHRSAIDSTRPVSAPRRPSAATSTAQTKQNAPPRGVPAHVEPFRRSASKTAPPGSTQRPPASSIPVPRGGDTFARSKSMPERRARALSPPIRQPSARQMAEARGAPGPAAKAHPIVGPVRTATRVPPSTAVSSVAMKAAAIRAAPNARPTRGPIATAAKEDAPKPLLVPGGKPAVPPPPSTIALLQRPGRHSSADSSDSKASSSGIAGGPIRRAPPIAGATAGAVHPPPPPPIELLTCQNCGKDFLHGARFCAFCGQRRDDGHETEGHPLNAL